MNLARARIADDRDDARPEATVAHPPAAVLLELDRTGRGAARRARPEAGARLRDFAEASSGWFWETDAEHRLAWVSERFQDVMGVDPARVLGRRRVDFRADDPADGDWDGHARLLAARLPFRDFRYGFADEAGRRRVVSVSGVPVVDGSGAFRGHRGTARDITREVEAEERLRDSEARFRSLVTNMRGIIFCHGVRGAGPHGYDEEGVALYGADAADIAGTRDEAGRARIASWYDAVHPDDRPAYLEAERRRKTLHEDFSLDYRITHPVTGERRWMREVAWVVQEPARQRTSFDSYIIDVTDHKRTEAALRESEERYRRLIEAAPIGILICAAAGGWRCTYANPCAVALLGGAAAGDFLDRPLEGLVAADDYRRLRRDLGRLAAGGALPPRELSCVRLDGGGRLVVEASAVAIAEGGAAAVQLVLVDLSERKRAAALRHLAQHDPLTGLPNRLLLTERLGEGVAAARGLETGLGVMALDLDGFKAVNDTFGHAAGDELLRQVARRIRAVVRDSDTLARVGGDEFAVVQNYANGPHNLALAAGRIIDAFSRPFRIDREEVRAGVSIGIASYPGDGTEPEDLLRKADMALYQAKETGRNRFCFFEPGLNAAVEARRELECLLRTAPERRELRLAYQPQLEMATGRLAGVEALLRWSSPVRGEVGPAEFIPIAEATGLIRHLGAWVLDEACAQARRWRDERGLELTVAVNVSPAQLREAEFGDLVAAALARHGLPAGRLCLELTESLLIDPRLEGIGPLLERLAGLGVRIAIDDFGTGCSSLVNLKRLPVHHVKIDRSFVAGVGSDPESEAIIQATVSLAHALGRGVIAEGVETVPQHEFLVSLGCDQAQGYMYGRPARPEAIGRLAARQPRAARAAARARS